MATDTSTINAGISATNTTDLQRSYEYPTSYQIVYNNHCPHRLPCGYCMFLMRDCVKTPYCRTMTV